MNRQPSRRAVAIDDTLDISFSAETELASVANGDFSGLSQPLLIAAGSYTQLDHFCWQNGIILSETTRVGRWPDRPWPADKIMILLEGWDLDPTTRDAVNSWVEHDGYTVEMPPPRLLVQRLIVIAIAAASIFLAARLWFIPWTDI